MRVLHVVKTSSEARWAAWQAGILHKEGIEVHVVIPFAEGFAVPLWKEAGAVIHVADFSVPVRSMWRWQNRRNAINTLIHDIAPDIIHAHFVTNSIAIRMAMGKNHSIPRVFQVAGPLHMEHSVFRHWELSTSGSRDYWIPTSRYTKKLYLDAGVPSDRVFMSYTGIKRDWFEQGPRQTTNSLRRKLGIPDEAKVVGDVSYMYPPKYILGQFTGLKRHEDLIDAMGLVCKQRKDMFGIFIGGQVGDGTGYRDKLVRRARSAAGDRIFLVDSMPPQQIGEIWREMDIAAHVPISENCGGVVEPLLARVPTIASTVGGLPEVVVDGFSGWLVPPRDPRSLADTILRVLKNPDEAQRRAAVGKRLVQTMFDINRTAKEIINIYQHIMDISVPLSREFDSEAFVKRTSDAAVPMVEAVQT